MCSCSPYQARISWFLTGLSAPRAPLILTDCLWPTASCWPSGKYWIWTSRIIACSGLCVYWGTLDSCSRRSWQCHPYRLFPNWFIWRFGGGGGFGGVAFLSAVKIKTFETDRFRKGCFVYISWGKPSSLSVVRAVMAFLTVRGDAPGPLFLLSNGQPLSRASITDWLRQPSTLISWVTVSVLGLPRTVLSIILFKPWGWDKAAVTTFTLGLLRRL